MLDAAIKELRSFNWDKVIENALSLETFNDGQWRFQKAYIIEKSLEKYSNSNLVYVAQKHKDFDWPKLNLTADQKGMTSASMYKKNGQLKKKYSIMLNNSMGTNTKETLDKSDICDIIICIYNDGVFIVDKETALKYLVKKGDGFGINVPGKDIIQITGRRYINNRNNKLQNLKKEIEDLIWSKI